MSNGAETPRVVLVPNRLRYDIVVDALTVGHVAQHLLTGRWEAWTRDGRRTYHGPERDSLVAALAADHEADLAEASRG